MALNPWINVLWAAAMLLNTNFVSHASISNGIVETLHGLEIEHILEITGRHVYECKMLIQP